MQPRGGRSTIFRRSIIGRRNSSSQSTDQFERNSSNCRRRFHSTTTLMDDGRTTRFSDNRPNTTEAIRSNEVYCGRCELDRWYSSKNGFILEGNRTIRFPHRRPNTIVKFHSAIDRSRQIDSINTFIYVQDGRFISSTILARQRIVVHLRNYATTSSSAVEEFRRLISSSKMTEKKILHISKLPDNATKEEVETRFKQYGDCDVWFNRRENVFARVKYHQPEHAAAAIRDLNQRDFLGSIVAVEYGWSKIHKKRRAVKRKRAASSSNKNTSGVSSNASESSSNASGSSSNNNSASSSTSPSLNNNPSGPSSNNTPTAQNSNVSSTSRAGSDSDLRQQIESEIMDTSSISLRWNDIAGLSNAKVILREVVVLPMIRPELFKGLRSPPRGILLFGPPGTGKTTIGRVIASQANATFYSITASSIVSKWVGESEKLVRFLFESARAHQPAVVFIDEIDSILCNRGEREHEHSRRLKTQFFTELDGMRSSEDERLLIIGATNRPADLDEAVRRRFTKRIYIPLPDEVGRTELLKNALKHEAHSLNANEMNLIVDRTNGFSCDDLTKLIKEAAMEPVRRIKDIRAVDVDEISPITRRDFKAALKKVRPSVMKEQLKTHEEFNRLFGSTDGI